MKNKIVFVAYCLLGHMLMACEEESASSPFAPKEFVLSAALEGEIESFLRAESVPVDGEIQVLDLSDGRWSRLMEVFTRDKPNNKLYFYFDNLHCNECIEREILYMKEYYSSEQVALLIRHPSQSEAQAFLAINELPYQVYLLRPDEHFSESLAMLSRPAYFRIREGVTLKNLFSPKYSYPELSIRFHTNMKALLDDD